MYQAGSSWNWMEFPSRPHHSSSYSLFLSWSYEMWYTHIHSTPSPKPWADQWELNPKLLKLMTCWRCWCPPEWHPIPFFWFTLTTVNLATRHSTYPACIAKFQYSPSHLVPDWLQWVLTHLLLNSKVNWICFNEQVFWVLACRSLAKEILITYNLSTSFSYYPSSKVDVLVCFWLCIY